MSNGDLATWFAGIVTLVGITGQGAWLYHRRRRLILRANVEDKGSRVLSMRFAFHNPSPFDMFPKNFGCITDLGKEIQIFAFNEKLISPNDMIEVNFHVGCDDDASFGMLKECGVARSFFVDDGLGERYFMAYKDAEKFKLQIADAVGQTRPPRRERSKEQSVWKVVK